MEAERLGIAYWKISSTRRAMDTISFCGNRGHFGREILDGTSSYTFRIRCANGKEQFLEGVAGVFKVWRFSLVVPILLKEMAFAIESICRAHVPFSIYSFLHWAYNKEYAAFIVELDKGVPRIAGDVVEEIENPKFILSIYEHGFEALVGNKLYYGQICEDGILVYDRDKGYDKWLDNEYELLETLALKFAHGNAKHH